jgi:N-acetyltransferase
LELEHVRASHGAVRLEPLDESHRAGLAAAARDPTLWAWWPRGDMGADFDTHFEWQKEENAAGRWLLHTVFEGDAIVGQTCYLNFRPEHASVEIGGTWYARGAQGSRVNPACKLMMLGHAFISGAERVELKTDALNAASRAAMLKMGATFEGVHRHHMRRVDGTWRDTAWYSVLYEEWPNVRADLEARLAL